MISKSRIFPGMKSLYAQCKILILLVASLYWEPMASPQIIATITLEAGLHQRNNTPVCIDIDQITSLPDSMLRLEEISGTQHIPVPVQIESGRIRKLWWIVSGQLNAGGTRTYELIKGPSYMGEKQVKAKSADGGLIVSVDNKNVLQYVFKTVYPPDGVDSSYRRSGFIHPLWSPQGAVLTNIQPRDHYHHYGIWNPWTETEFEGREIDFWNLARKLGTVRFKSFVSIVEGPVYGGFKALQDHVIFPDSAEKTVMKETWDIRVYNLPADVFLWDFTSTLNLATPSPLKIKEYRYAGFGMRATADWTNASSKALTSEGKTRKDADGSRARWCMINGETSKGLAGVLFMTCPTNYNFPEPVRMWPENANDGRGDVFFNFCPTKNMDWNLIAGRDYTLNYRIMVYKGDLSKESAEALWTDFAEPPVIKFSKK